MNNLWRELRTGPDCPEFVYAIVETPKGARNKLEYNIESGVLVLNRVFEVYKDLEGALGKPIGWEDASAARQAIQRAVGTFGERFAMKGL